MIHILDAHKLKQYSIHQQKNIFANIMHDKEHTHIHIYDDFVFCANIMVTDCVDI